MTHYVSGSSCDWPTRTKPFVVFLGSIATAEFAPIFRFEPERFLCSLPDVNIKILPGRSKDPNSILSAVLSRPKRTTYNAWHRLLRISLKTVWGSAWEDKSPKYPLIHGYKCSVLITLHFFCRSPSGIVFGDQLACICHCKISHLHENCPNARAMLFLVCACALAGAYVCDPLVMS
jgi:hypothetical protein